MSNRLDSGNTDAECGIDLTPPGDPLGDRGPGCKGICP